MKRAKAERSVGRPSRLRIPILARVAISDVGWLVILVPLGALFQVLLLLARGYYVCRRLGRAPALVYTAVVIIGLGCLLRLVTRRIGR